jgi:hypothetical protein
LVRRVGRLPTGVEKHRPDRPVASHKAHTSGWRSGRRSFSRPCHFHSECRLSSRWPFDRGDAKIHLGKGLLRCLTHHCRGGEQTYQCYEPKSRDAAKCGRTKGQCPA